MALGRRLAPQSIKQRLVGREAALEIPTGGHCLAPCSAHRLTLVWIAQQRHHSVRECNVIVKRDKKSVLLLRQKMRHRAVDVADQGAQATASTTLRTGCRDNSGPDDRHRIAAD